MSKHRVKTIAVDDDYDDGYDYDEEYGDGAYAEDDEISPEDKEKLRIGTAQVRSALGQGFPSTSDKEIQDTLWHYYYDVGKSVTFLKSTFFLKRVANPSDFYRPAYSHPEKAGKVKIRKSQPASNW